MAGRQLYQPDAALFNSKDYVPTQDGPSGLAMQFLARQRADQDKKQYLDAINATNQQQMQLTQSDAQEEMLKSIMSDPTKFASVFGGDNMRPVMNTLAKLQGLPTIDDPRYAQQADQQRQAIDQTKALDQYGSGVEHAAAGGDRLRAEVPGATQADQTPTSVQASDANGNIKPSITKDLGGGVSGKMSMTPEYMEKMSDNRDYTGITSNDTPAGAPINQIANAPVASAPQTSSVATSQQHLAKVSQAVDARLRSIPGSVALDKLHLNPKTGNLEIEIKIPGRAGTQTVTYPNG